MMKSKCNRKKLIICDIGDHFIAVRVSKRALKHSLSAAESVQMDVLLSELDNSSGALSEYLHSEISAEGRREAAV